MIREARMVDMKRATSRRAAIDEKLAKELAAYKGRWVALHNGRVVASGASAREAAQAALGKKVTDPLLFRVTAHPERLRVF
jgi:hypothetical protein